MTPERARELKEVYLAFCDGKIIQYKALSDPASEWRDMCDPEDSDIAFDSPGSYRVKPEPMTIWVNVYSHRVYQEGWPDEVCRTREGAEAICGKDGITKEFREVI